MISLELEQITPAWLSIINTVQKMAEVEIDSLIRCREIAAQILKDKNMLPTGYQFKSHPVVACGAIARSRSFKRKADHVDLEEDFYDGIKRLYNDEQNSSDIGLDSSASAFAKANPVCAK